MADGEFHLVFRGELTGTLPEETVRQNLARVFRMSADRVADLFSGKPVVIKRNVDEATARKFESAFRNAGAVCELRPVERSSESTAAAAREPANTDTGGRQASAPAGRGAATRSSIAAAGDPHGTIVDVAVPTDLGDLAIDDSGQPLQPPAAVEPPRIDTSELDLAPDGGSLSQAAKPEAPRIDTSGLELEPPPS